MWYFVMLAHSVHSVIQTWMQDHTWRTRIYVGVNAFRAIFPVKVVERECLTMVSSPLIDRTLATENEELNNKLWKFAGYEEPPTVELMVEEQAKY